MVVKVVANTDYDIVQWRKNQVDTHGCTFIFFVLKKKGLTAEMFLCIETP
jgi:hypothetical protein